MKLNTSPSNAEAKNDGVLHPLTFNLPGKVQVNVKFILGQAKKAFFFNLCTRGSRQSTPRPGRFTPRKDPVPTVQEAGWAPSAGLQG